MMTKIKKIYRIRLTPSSLVWPFPKTETLCSPFKMISKNKHSNSAPITSVTAQLAFCLNLSKGSTGKCQSEGNSCQSGTANMSTSSTKSKMNTYIKGNTPADSTAMDYLLTVVSWSLSALILPK